MNVKLDICRKFSTLAMSTTLLGACTFLGFDGQHDAWKEFHDRCIRQISEAKPVSTNELDQKSIYSIKQGLRAKQDPQDSYWGPENTLWILQTNRERNSCKFHVNSRGTLAFEKGMNWLAAANETGFFEPDHHISSEGLLHFEDGTTAEIFISWERHNKYITDAYFYIKKLGYNDKFVDQI